MHVHLILFFVFVAAINAQNASFPDCKFDPLSTFPICDQSLPFPRPMNPIPGPIGSCRIRPSDEIWVAESNEILRVGFFCWVSLDFVGFGRTVRRNPIKSDPKDFIRFHNPDSALILQDTIGFRRIPMGSVLDPIGSVVGFMDLCPSTSG
jgi:hypothetical protein